MAWLFAVLLVLLIGAVAVVAAGRGEGISPSQSDDPRPELPETPLTPGDLRAVRFNTAVRGYRADEVDALLARIATEWEERG